MTNTFGAYKRVFMLGIDGMGAFNRFAPTPNMDRLFANGATTYTALASKPTISTCCWTSMLTGAIPEVHGLIQSCIPPAVPTIFRMVKDAYPDACTAAFTDWSPIAEQIIAPGGGMDDFDIGAEDGLCERLLSYLDNHDPKLLFVQFDGCDNAGHTTGYGSQGHLDSITHADALLGRLIAKYEERGLTEDTLFIVTADHGGTVHCSHGDGSDAERLVFLGVTGHDVLHGPIGDVAERDFPAIVLHALGIKSPDFDPEGFAAQMPVGIFPDVGITDRKEIYPRFTPPQPEKRAQPTPDSAEHIGNFIDTSRIRFWQTFENGADDVTGQCSVTVESGIVKTYNNGFIGKSGEFGAGVVRVDGMTHADVFSIGFWFFTTPDGRWMDLFSNADGIHDNFSIAPYGERVGIYIKEPDGNQTDRTRLGAEAYESSPLNLWTHFLFEIDTTKDEISVYINFEKIETMKVSRPIAPHFDMHTFRMAAAQHNNEAFCKVVDDVMVIDGPADIDALRKYYRV